jgi:hypothetical protein
MRDCTADEVKYIVPDEEGGIDPARPKGVVAGSPDVWAPCHRPYGVHTTLGMRVCGAVCPPHTSPVPTVQ